MYVITGATGNTGHLIAKRLLEQGKKVRVLGRSPEKLAPLAALGAEAFAANLTDADAVAQAFSGAEAAYLMLPPNLATDDVLGYQREITNAFAEAIESNEITHVVALSSIGADKTEKTGPVVGLHVLEEKLRSIAGLNTLALRPAYFMENTLPQAAIIHGMGVAAGPLRADMKIPMIETRDIGAYAADALLQLEFKGFNTLELLGPRDISYLEITEIIGKAIGKPELKYNQIPYEHFAAALQQMGISQNMAGLLAELSEALNTGHVSAIEPRSAKNTTSTPYEQFVAEEFVPAYQGKAAA